MKINTIRLFNTITVVATLLTGAIPLAHAESIEDCVRNSALRAAQAAEWGGEDISRRDKQKDMALSRKACVDNYSEIDKTNALKAAQAAEWGGASPKSIKNEEAKEIPKKTNKE